MKKLSFIMAMVFVAVASYAQTGNTIANLKMAVDAENESIARYEAYSRQAYEDGYPNIGNMFGAMARGSQVHMSSQQAVLSDMGQTYNPAKAEDLKVGSTLENLRAEMKQEERQDLQDYPKYIERARTENLDEAARAFQYVSQSELNHIQMYQDAITAITQQSNDRDIAENWYICPVCGDVYSDKKEVENCGVCDGKWDNFIKYERPSDIII